MSTLAKRILSMVLSLCMCLSMFTMLVIQAEALTQSEFEKKLEDARLLYPTGSQREEWSINGSVVGWQCHGYARWLSWYVWGVDFANGYGTGWSLKKATNISSKLEELVPGDVVRFRREGKTWNHTIFVTSITSDKIYYTDCNSDGRCTIKWGQSISKTDMERALKLQLYNSATEAATYGYIAHYSSNTLSGGGVHTCTKGEYVYYEAAHPHYSCYRCSICGNVWADTASFNLVASCTACATLEKPIVSTDQTTYYTGNTVTVQWNAVSGNDYYWINVYKDDVLIVDQSMGASTSYTLNDVQEGKYAVLVSANNSLTHSGSNSCEFNVIRNIPPAAPEIQASAAHTVTGQGITVSWNAVENATAYIYYVAEYPSAYAYDTYVQCNTTTKTTVTFTDLPNGKYIVFVHAINGAGTWGNQSNTLWMEFYNYDYVPAATTVWNGHLYALYDEAMSWDLAQSLCEMQNACLATITSAEENAIITDLITCGNSDGYWLGGRNDNPNGYEITGDPYRWVSGEAFSYSNWASGEPNGIGNGAETEHFLEIRKSIGNSWNDVKHATKNGFILEMDVSGFTPVDSTTYGGSKYYLFEQNISWTEARAYCESLGGHLATIHSREEDVAVSELLTKGTAYREWFYIGSTSQCGTWKWIDGADVSMSNESSNWGNIHGEAQTGPTGWNDYLMKYRSTGTWIGIQNFYLPKSNMNRIGFICEVDDAIYNVTFHANGGNNAPDVQTKENGIPLVLSKDVPNKSGYRFLGWSTDLNSAEIKYQPGDTYVVDSDITLYAVWEKIECAHLYDDWFVTVVNTCLEPGEKRRECKMCDYYEVQEVSASGHTEVIDKSSVPTCIEPGMTEGKHCETCGEILVAQEEIPATGHTYGDWTESKAATCTEKGEQRRDCTNCDHFETRITEPKGHTEVIDSKVDPTCTEPGLTEGKKCELCGEILVEQEEIPATGHNYGDWTESQAASCTEEGQERRNCANCDHFETRKIAVKGHTEVIDEAVAATCDKDGLTEGKHCSFCNETLVKQEIIKATGHEFGEWKTVVEPSEEAEGKAIRQCDKCDEMEEKVLPKLDHVHIYAEQTTEPSCTEEGYTTYTCACGESYKDYYAPAMGHTEVIDEAVHVTCVQNGLTEGSHCSVCGETLVKQEVIEAIGHEFGEWDTVVEPTEDTEGKAVRQCPLCNETEEKVLPKLDHVHIYTEKIIEPTCTEQGYTTYTCTCGKSYKDNNVEAKGHTEAIDPKVDPTCTEPGKTEGKHCDICGEVLVAQEEIPVIEHKWDNGQITKEPTATEDGVKTCTCTACGEIKTEAIPATGEEIVWGDANGDGKVNTKDATRILRYYAGLISDSEIDLVAADVNGDGNVNTKDATRILRYYAELIDSLRPEK